MTSVQGTTGPGLAIEASEFLARREAVAAEAGRRGLAGLVVVSRGGGTLDRYGDVLYLTNFYTSFPFIPDLDGAWNARAHTALVMAADGRARLVTDCPDDGRVAMEQNEIVRTDFVCDALVDIIADMGLGDGIIGLVGSDTLPANLFVTLRAALPGVQWRDEQDILKRLRAIKTPGEIALLRHASEVGSRTMEAMMAASEPGVSHGEIVAAGCNVLLPAGGLFYNSFMASGRGGDDPVYVRSTFPTWGSRAPLEDGHWLRLGISGVVEGYYFDHSRSKAIGTPTNRQIQLFEDVIAIVEAAIAAIRPGVTAEAVARAGLEKQESLGYPNDGVFSGLGHGLGLGWDAPWLAPGDTTVIEPGMVLCIERTISKDGYLGDFEETVVVTEEGCEKISVSDVRYW